MSAKPTPRMQLPRPLAERFSALAETFPSLRGAPGTRPFDPLELAIEHDRRRHDDSPDGVNFASASAFVIHLFQRAGIRTLPDAALTSTAIRQIRAVADDFELTEAAHMDAEHSAALAAWIASPWLPDEDGLDPAERADESRP